MATTDPYTPIACGLHDELQLRSLRRTRVQVRFRSPGAAREITIEGRIVDVLTHESAEFLVMDDGLRIRLDHLTEVDGIPFRDAC